MANKALYLDRAALAAEISGNTLSGAYVFFGEEDYLKRYDLSEAYRAVMTAPGMEIFNYSKISFSAASQSRDEAFSALASSTASLPMMQEKRLTEIHDLPIDGISASDLGLLCDNLAVADESNVVILCLRKNEWEFTYKTESSSEFKKLSEVARLVRYDPLTPQKLKTWAGRRFAAEKIRATDEALGLLCELCACDMFTLSEEIAKLIFYAHGEDKKDLTADDVRAVACPAAVSEAPPFAMLEAAQKWSLTDMVQVMATARDLREEPIAVLAKLGRIFSDMLRVKAGLEKGLSVSQIAAAMKIKEYSAGKYAQAVRPVPMKKLEDMIRLAVETDVGLKSAPSDPWVLLDILITRVYVPRSLL
ncbi:MAG: DNA polymerase III subunit delta [Ruminococcus sp.]|nr:DNA polymerase III subunit delta [Candidatus Apopatosoma intestinale]